MSERPLRILHLTLGADAGGLSTYIIRLGTAMRALGHQITVAGDSGAWQWAFEESKLPYVQIPLKGGYFAFRKCVKTMREFLAQNPVDVIHTHYRRATLLGRKMHKPIVYTLHLSHIDVRFPRNLFTDFGDIAIIASEDARQWMTDTAKFPADRLRYIPHGIDLNKYSITTPDQRATARNALKLQDTDRVAIYVGRLNDPKNEDWLLDVATTARASIRNLKVLLVGEGPHEQMLRERMSRENLSDIVRLEGHQETLPYYRAADAILLPSIREGFSYVCAEAMATGVPALRTRTSGTRELIVENVTGRSTPIDHDAFVSASVEFLRDAEALRKMGIAASDHVRKNFDFQTQLQKTLDVYRSMTRMNDDA